MDEPLASLDAPLRRELRGEIVRWLRPWAPTVLWVTHDQEEALEVADWLGVMRQGGLEQCGPPAEVCRQPATPFVAQFFAPMMAPRRWPWEGAGEGARA
jgi:putative spermidine/putrescine transport system ATP-binding protein